MNEELETALRSLVRGFEGALPSKDIAMVDELLVVGEYGVAFENLCTQLYDYGVKISQTQYQQLESVGRKMGIRNDEWEKLIPRINDYH